MSKKAWGAFWEDELGYEGMFSNDDPTAALLARDQAVLESLKEEGGATAAYRLLSAIDAAIDDGDSETARWLIGEVSSFDLDRSNLIAIASFHYRLGDHATADALLAELEDGDVTGSWGLMEILQVWIDRHGVESGIAAFNEKFGDDAVGWALMVATSSGENDEFVSTLIGSKGIEDYLGRPSNMYMNHGGIIAEIEQASGPQARDAALGLVLPNVLEDDPLSVLSNLSTLALFLTRHGCSPDCLAPLAQAARNVEFNVPGTATRQTEIVPLEIDAARGKLDALPPDAGENLLNGLINHAATYAVAHNDLDYVEPLIVRLGHEKQDAVLGHLVGLLLDKGPEAEPDAVRLAKRATMNDPSHWSSAALRLAYLDGFETLRETLLIERLNSCVWPQ